MEIAPHSNTVILFQDAKKMPSYDSSPEEISFTVSSLGMVG